jgi:hypothetical protein
LIRAGDQARHEATCAMVSIKRNYLVPLGSNYLDIDVVRALILAGLMRIARRKGHQA